MKVSGFTLIKNAVRLNLPVVESIRSVLPMVDEFVVAVGDSDDATEELIRSIDDPKLFIVPTRWNPNFKTGGYVLAQQTNAALMNCTGEWAVYVQADEAIHEDHHSHLMKLMQRYRTDDGVESLSLHRLNFYGDYRTHYTPVDDLCVRIVKPHKFVLSRGDAAGFTVHPKYKERGRRITTIDTGLPLFHYFEIRTPEQRREKLETGIELGYRKKDDLSAAPAHDDLYRRAPRQLVARFEGTHPAPMAERIQQHDFVFDHDSPLLRTQLTSRERRFQFREFLSKHVSPAFRQGAASSRLVGKSFPEKT